MKDVVVAPKKRLKRLVKVGVIVMSLVAALTETGCIDLFNAKQKNAEKQLESKYGIDFEIYKFGFTEYGYYTFAYPSGNEKLKFYSEFSETDGVPMHDEYVLVKLNIDIESTIEDSFYERFPNSLIYVSSGVKYRTIETDPNITIEKFLEDYPDTVSHIVIIFDLSEAEEISCEDEYALIEEIVSRCNYLNLIIHVKYTDKEEIDDYKETRENYLYYSSSQMPTINYDNSMGQRVDAEYGKILTTYADYYKQYTEGRKDGR